MFFSLFSQSICIRSRVVEIYRDYQKMCDVDSFFCRYSFDQYLRIRLLIGRSLSSLSSLFLAATSGPISTR